MRRRVAVGGAGWAHGWPRPPPTRSARPGRRRWQRGRAPSWWARIANTSRSQSGSSNCTSRSAAATSSEMTISLTAPARVSRRRRRSNGESSQLLIIPPSSQTLHCHRIGAPGSVRSTIIRPGQRRLAGRRRHGSALSQGCGITGCCRPNNVAQVLGQSACGPGRVGRQVEEVVQVGDHHSAGLYRTRPTGTDLLRGPGSSAH